MNTIVMNAAVPCQCAPVSDHVLVQDWRDAAASQGAVRPRDERSVRLGADTVAAATAAAVTPAAVKAAAFAYVPGPAAWSPPPC